MQVGLKIPKKSLEFPWICFSSLQEFQRFFPSPFSPTNLGKFRKKQLQALLGCWEKLPAFFWDFQHSQISGKILLENPTKLG